MHPLLLPKLVESNIVAESSLSDNYKEEQAKKVQAKAKAAKKPEKRPEPVKPEVVVQKPVVTAPMPAPVTPDPVPEPEPVTPKMEVKLNDEEFISALQSSVKVGDVNEFKIEQVLDWKREGEELIDNDTYDVGVVTFKAQTIYDEQQLQAKALIKDGKVVKWLWPVTNTEMK